MDSMDSMNSTSKHPSKPIILVVDDSPENLDVLKSALCEDYIIRPTIHGTSALKLAKLLPQPDLILLDIMMPEMDGYEVCQQLKANPKTQAIPIIFITAKTQVEDEVKGLEIGGVDYIQKPISPPVVKARVKTHLALKCAQIHLEKNNQKLLEMNEKLSISLEQLSASEERFRNLVQTIPDIVYKIDAEGTFTFVNKAVEQLGYHPSELVGQHFTEIIHPSDRDRVHREKLLGNTLKVQPKSYLKMFDERRTRDRRTCDLELRLKSKSGSEAGTGEFKNISYQETFVEVNSSGLYGESFEGGKSFGENQPREKRNYIGTVGVIRNITQQKKIQEKLQEAKEQAEEATRLKDKFVSLVAHDLRSPLGAMLGSVEYVLDDGDHSLPEIHQQLLGSVLNSGQNLIKCIEGVLNIGRLKTGKITLEKKFFNAHALVRVMAQQLEHLRKKKGLTIDNVLPEEMRLFADQTLIGEVVQNLLSNAIKFTQPDTVIRVFAPDKKRAILAVQDRGVGISQEMLPKLFSIDEKTSTPGTQGEQGTGFGLPFSFDLMQAHAGTLTVTSEPNKGSTFTLALPMVQPRILVVDDEVATWRLLKQMLQPLHVEVVEAINGQEAMERIQKRPIHLIFSDLHMPTMDGFALLKELKKDNKTKDIPFILMSERQDMATKDAAFRLGASDFTVKPLQPNDLLPRIRYFLGG